ncbi:uncharacterized protein LOC116254770 isoform X2 [Nymphaea colorata]|uniref:uncharacterized protein LOC116254770 isoform X2 n=1 Tax=Nymphaea colorata TaxID=210225 RepID=UPI00129D94E8|nr:uncharacterized protein LOC116254770 isoform X2 [Nymphaea colorata]
MLATHSHTHMKLKLKSGSISDMYENQTSKKLIDNMDDKEEKKSFGKLLKAVELLGSSQLSWKERKKMEDQSVASLGGKPKKNCKMPVILGRNIMKKRQEKEQKLFEEGLIDQIPRKYTSKSQKTRREDQVLKISQGNFRNGMLDVKHILRKDEAASRVEDHNHGGGKDKKRGKRKQQNSKKRRRRS